MAKRVFIAGTGQNEGKTTVAMGVIAALQNEKLKVGFIKPVGQRYVEYRGYKVDEDSVLIEQACELDCHLKDMSPIAIEKGFTRRFIDGSLPADLYEQIVESFGRVEADNDIVVIEGTGHAGVGTVINLSNAGVAKLLKAKVVLVTGGGIGRPIDEVALNRTFFEANDVQVIGAALNRVLPSKLDSTASYVRKGLQRQGLKLLGAIPYEAILAGPSIGQILEDTAAELLHGEECLGNLAHKIIIGAMSPHMALEYFSENVLLITPGDREDMILTAIASALLSGEPTAKLAGIVLTGGIFPHKNIIRIIRKTQVPVLLMEEDSYTAASKIHDLIIKIRPCDTKKIELAKGLVKQCVDIEAIVKSI